VRRRSVLFTYIRAAATANYARSQQSGVALHRSIAGVLGAGEYPLLANFVAMALGGSR
jgi:hypothetical protein